MASSSRLRKAVGTWQGICSTACVKNHLLVDGSSVSHTNAFYTEHKWCEACSGYVRYLMSVNRSYCADCGGQVRLFSGKDGEHFQDRVQRNRWQAS